MNVGKEKHIELLYEERVSGRNVSVNISHGAELNATVHFFILSNLAHVRDV